MTHAQTPTTAPEDTPTPAEPAEEVNTEEASPPAAPDYLPAKFWDDTAGEIRVEDLARSYMALEKRLGAAGGDIVPESPEDYRIESAMDGLTSDPEVNARLIDAGFTQTQAQLVYDLAAEKLAPLVQDFAIETVQNDQRRRLADHFGGQDRWQTTSSQIETWGRANLPGAVFDVLSTSYDGVLTLHRMMQEGEPQLLSGTSPATAGRSESQLRKMMQDPRYWRDHDPAFAAEIRRGFNDLYPDEG